MNFACLSAPKLGILTMTSLTERLATHCNELATSEALLPVAEGALVQSVSRTIPSVSGAPVSENPFRPADVIVALGGLPVTTASEAQRIGAAWPTGQPIWANVLRGHERVKLIVMVGGETLS